VPAPAGGGADWLNIQAAYCVKMIADETAFRPSAMLGSRPEKLNPALLDIESVGSGGPELLGRIVPVT
jgi:hypothetical protein